MRTWPSARRPIRTSSSAPRLPTTARSISVRTRSQRSARSSIVMGGCSWPLDPFDGVDGGAELGERAAAGEAVRGSGAVGAHELPRLGAERGGRRVRLLVQLDAAVR